ncbi:SDR family NAD(P)-dependent oxidoreductase, partial [Pseudomonas aeruginosa]|uniref:SDR family NAD(P)-dependent oxidoreductase n=2 Tax=Bacteria TaxID=2 RepID=UPI0009CE6C19
MIGFGRKMRNYSGACALVTGGASGLGLELVRLLAADGARVLATDIHENVDPSLLPNGVDYLRLDVRSDDDWAGARTWVQSHWGHLDL